MRDTFTPSPPAPPPPPAPTQTTVLFSVPGDQLPDHLPSVDEIESSPHVLKRLDSTRCVVRVREHFVVKYGCEVDPAQGQNMIFARRYLNNLVPRVLAIYQKTGPMLSTITYIVMEYFHGRQLDEAWSTLDNLKRLQVVNVLRDALQLIRSIPPPNYFGGLEMTQLIDDIFYTMHPTPAKNGPFKTEKELVHGMILCYRDQIGHRLGHRADYFSRVLPQFLKGNGKPVFTHGDLQRKNIMIGSRGEIAILDWDLAGWYPVWWEYAIMTEGCGNWKDDWHEYIPKILDEYPNQYAWSHALRVEMWS
ncbi:kinase-like domain-containing protein [Xylaria sp. FL1777]|nr:kinase-like domain-containing protein [Xylaria sp. FL1777]